MSYYFAKTLKTNFPQAVERVAEALKSHGFGIITEIDIRDTFKKKLGVDYRNYRILGACNPRLAHEALSIEDKIGTMLPCNVVVQELPGGAVEVARSIPLLRWRPSTTRSYNSRRSASANCCSRSSRAFERLAAGAPRLVLRAFTATRHFKEGDVPPSSISGRKHRAGLFVLQRTQL
jgi:uncharacterized protein (DUF302 family)